MTLRLDIDVEGLNDVMASHVVVSLLIDLI
jgi:hypothetical protein